MLKGKTVVVGVTGGIAAYKSAQLVSDLVKLNADVHVVMTQNALHFINPITFETLTNHKCLVDTFDRNFQFHVAHVSLSQKADVFIVAPASADVIGKFANGIADDMLTTMALAATCKILVAPAMNRYMYKNSIVQENLDKLRRHGFGIIEPAVGRLACDDVGVGKLPDIDVLIEAVTNEIAHEKDMKNQKVLITAGPTVEALDPVRFISNHSTGKMGYALARVACERGAEVTLVSGPVSIQPPHFVRTVPVCSAKEMFHAVTDHSDEYDVIIMAAAVADYTPQTVSDQKIKKKDGDLSIPLKRTQDILAYLGQHKTDRQVICGFSMETQDLLENSKKKLLAKNCDMIAANSLSERGSGFGTDTNKLTLITSDGVDTLDLLTKYDASNVLLDKVNDILNQKKA